MHADVHDAPRFLVKHQKPARYFVFMAALLALLLAVGLGALALGHVRSRDGLIDWLQDQYTYVLFWLVVTQAGVAAAASGVQTRSRTRFRWIVAALCALLAYPFPILGGWHEFGVAYGAFVAGVLVVAIMDATVGDVWVDYLPRDDDKSPFKDDLRFIVPTDNLQAVHVHISRAVGHPAPSIRDSVRFARKARTDHRHCETVGRARLHVEVVDTALCAIRVSGRLLDEERARLNLVIGILGNPTIHRHDRSRIHVNLRPPARSA